MVEPVTQVACHRYDVAVVCLRCLPNRLSRLHDHYAATYIRIHGSTGDGLDAMLPGLGWLFRCHVPPGTPER